MRLHRFYINTPITSDSFDITDKDLVHQWKKVFRYNVGSQVILFDGSGMDYLCMISSIRNLGATVGILKKHQTADVSSRRNIWLCMSLIKKDNFDLVVQKATELGVNHIIPIISEHSEKKKLNQERMKKIAIEASEQSGRGDILEIFNTMTLKEVFETGLLPQEKIVLHPIRDLAQSETAISNGTGPKTIPFRQYINNTNQASFAVFVGPEGGFSPKEIDFFKQYNVSLVSFGPQILRAETAGIAISSLLLL